MEAEQYRHMPLKESTKRLGSLIYLSLKLGIREKNCLPVTVFKNFHHLKTYNIPNIALLLKLPV